MRRFAICLIAAVLAACAGGDGEGVPFHGYMVLRPDAADFGLTPGDTLIERPADSVPRALREEIQREVRRIDYERGCTRYFVSGTFTVVLAQKSCTNPPDQSHNWGFVLFRQEGDGFVRDPRPFEAITTMCPGERDKRGRASSSCP